MRSKERGKRTLRPDIIKDHLHRFRAADRLHAFAERLVQEGIRHADNGVTFLSMNPAVAQRLVNNISTAADNAVNTDAQPVLLVTPLIRPHLAQIVTRFLPTVPVISQAEIPPDIRLQSVGVVSAD